MAQDIFGNTVTLGKPGFRKEAGQGVFFAGGQIALVQDVTISYSQQVQPLYEVGSSTVYLTSVPASGSLSIQAVVSGKHNGQKGIMDAVKDLTVCNPDTVTLSVPTGCNGGDVTFKCQGCVASQASISAQAQNAYVMNNVTITFVSLEQS